MNLLERVKKIASDQGISLREVNDRAGLGANSIYRWKKQTPSIKGVAAVANVLNVPISELLYDKHEKGNLENYYNQDNIAKSGYYTIRIPVLGRFASCEQFLTEKNIEGYRYLSFLHKPDGDMFILKCHGKSMEPTLRDNSFVTIRVQPTVENGEMAAVLIVDEATIKRVFFKNDEIILKPDNPNYGYIRLNKENPGKILGKVVHMDVDF